jgi:cell division protease FtsH
MKSLILFAYFLSGYGFYFSGVFMKNTNMVISNGNNERNIDEYKKNNIHKKKYDDYSFNDIIKKITSENESVVVEEVEYDEDEELYGDGEDASDFLKRQNQIKTQKIQLLVSNKQLTIEDINNIFNNQESKNDYDIKKNQRTRYVSQNKNKKMEKNGKSEHFEVLTNFNFTFKDIGGYEEIKEELNQCKDVLQNYQKYSSFNVRIPKGVILEGPPGNGKTLLAKGFAGESDLPFICVSGAEFQEKYVGVGSSKVRELFSLAEKNIPCVIFIDELDALGKKRSSDGESSSSERDSTLNELLVSLDGFKTKNGIFLIGATNRIDLLDPALLRPGRIDKKIFVPTPDIETRKAIIDIHIEGKPYDKTITLDELVYMTDGFSGAEIENILNEGMLHALRKNRNKFNSEDIDLIYNKMIAGWQSSKQEYSLKMIRQICVHEIGHTLVAFSCQNHPKVKKVTINLNSPKTPGYTIFEKNINKINKYEELNERIMILLGGRIAEELIYGESVTIGCTNDFEETLILAEKMIVTYGFGKNAIYSLNSEKTKETVDKEIMDLINRSYTKSKIILENNKELLLLLSEKLQNKKTLSYQDITGIINFYSNIKEPKEIGMGD